MIFFMKCRKGQSSLEFLILIGFALILVAGLLVIFQDQVSSMSSAREDVVVDQMFNLVLSEFDFAMVSRPVYNRTFFLPRSLGGFDYNVSIIDDVEVVLEYRGVEYVRFLEEGQYSIDGDFEKGRNILVKPSSGVLSLNT